MIDQERLEQLRLTVRKMVDQEDFLEPSESAAILAALDLCVACADETKSNYDPSELRSEIQSFTAALDSIPRWS